VLKIENISVSLSNSVILDAVTFNMESNSCYALTGDSGIGKTTLLNIIAGLQQPSSGTISYNETLFNDTNTFLEPWLRDIGMVFQDLALWPHMTVLEHLNYCVSKDLTENKNLFIEQVLQTLHLQDFKNRLPMQLSGGQQQRLALGRVLVKQPKIILLDEAFNQLDLKLQKQMWVLLKEYQLKTKCIILFVTHDLKNTIEYVDKVLLIDNKKILYKT